MTHSSVKYIFVLFFSFLDLQILLFQLKVLLFFSEKQAIKYFALNFDLLYKVLGTIV